MESIPGYDDWKTTPPDDPEPASVCDCCGCEVYERHLCDVCSCER